MQEDEERGRGGGREGGSKGKEEEEKGGGGVARQPARNRRETGYANGKHSQNESLEPESITGEKPI